MTEIQYSSASAGTGKSALLVIDVQQEMFAKNTPVFNAEALLANINSLAERARSADAPVVFIQHCGESMLIKDTPGWQVHSSLRIQPEDLRVHKQHGNSFEGTGLKELLAEHGVTRVVACGMVTHGCVKNTCQGGLAEGYQVVLAGDAHSSYSKDAAEKVREWNQKLAAEGVRVLTSTEISF